MRELIKVCKNGTKVYKESCTCERCGGRGWYAIGVNNGQLVPSHIDHGVCYECNGTGISTKTVREYTPEHKAELEAKAEKKRIEAERKRREYEEKLAQQAAERKAQEEAERKARYESHKYVGCVGDKVDIEATYLWRGSYDTYFGTTYIYTFEDENGARFVWKTSKYMTLEENTKVRLTGTIKEHSEYNGIRQNVVTRCKVA